MTTKTDGKKGAAEIDAEIAARDAAVEVEAKIAADAAELRQGVQAFSDGLLLSLLPLLRAPIPEGYIVRTPVTTGKPYESAGVRSVQVQINRMDAVLTPLWWRDRYSYEQDGKLCQVTVEVGPAGAPVFSRSSWGGVDRGSSLGNVRKGSYTNAAKRAFAMVGPGHEIYLGVLDLDPDVNPAAAGEAAGKQAGGRRITAKRAGSLFAAAAILDLEDKLQLAASHVHGSDVGDASTAEAASVALRKLSVGEADKLEEWLARKHQEASS